MEAPVPEDPEPWARRYRLCCRCLHLRMVATLASAFDLLALGLPFVRGIMLYMTIRSNPVATGWFVVASMLYLLAIVAILSCLYGIWWQQSLWILPHLVLKLFTIMICFVAICFLSYLVSSQSSMMADLVTQKTEMTYRAATSTVKIGGVMLILAWCLFTAQQVWMLLVLRDCYRYTRTKELIDKLEKIGTGPGDTIDARNIRLANPPCRSSFKRPVPEPTPVYASVESMRMHDDYANTVDCYGQYNSLV